MSNYINCIGGLGVTPYKVHTREPRMTLQEVSLYLCKEKKGLEKRIKVPQLIP